MRLHQPRHKLISLFVLAFLCLNAGGILCLTYCGQSVRAKGQHQMAGASHCPHHPQPPADPGDQKATSASAVKCCMLPIGMIAAPLEKKAAVDVPVVATAIAEQVLFLCPNPTSELNVPLDLYRPPPKDRRPDRIRNQVFRI